MEDPARARIEPAPYGLIRGVLPLQVFHRPSSFIRRQPAERPGVEQRPAHRIHQVGEHAPVLGEPRHEGGTVEGPQAGLAAHAVRDRGVRVPQEHLGVVPYHVQVEVRQQADRVAAANGGDDAVDPRVGEGRHQVIRPRPRVARQPLGLAQGVRGLGHHHAELLLELPLAGGVAVGKRARPAPGQRDRCHAAAAPQSWWLDHRRRYGEQCHGASVCSTLRVALSPQTTTRAAVCRARSGRSGQGRALTSRSVRLCSAA